MSMTLSWFRKRFQETVTGSEAWVMSTSPLAKARNKLTAIAPHIPFRRWQG